MGRKRYPLVLMLEPLFRCNLACAGCGKIDYPDAILNKRLSVEECLDAVDECGAPMVAIPGGEPLIHKEIGEIVKGIVARKKFVSLCTNALLLEKKLHLFEPSPYLFFSVHLDGLKEHHDKSVCLEGVFEKAVAAIKAAKAKGFRRQRQLHDLRRPSRRGHRGVPRLHARQLGVGVSISPGYAYERAPDQQHFLNRRKTKELFRNVFALGKGKKWNFIHSALFLDFLAGNQELSLHAVGHADAQHLRLAEALLSARRRLRQDLHGTDGDDRLGHLRHRPLREVRQLHGALRLRGDRRRGHGRNSARRRWRSPGAASRPKGRWRRKSRSTTSGRRNTCSTARCSSGCRKSAPRGAGEGGEGSGEDRGERCVSSAVIHAVRAPAPRPAITVHHIPYATAGVLPRLRLR